MLEWKSLWIHTFSKDSNTRSQIAVRLAAGIFCFSPHLGEISWFLKMVSHTRQPFPLSGCRIKQAFKVTAGQSVVFNYICLYSSLSTRAHFGIPEPTKLQCLSLHRVALWVSFQKTNDLWKIAFPAQLFLHPQPRATVTEGVLERP